QKCAAKDNMYCLPGFTFILKVFFMTHNGFGLRVGGLLKPKTVCQHQRVLIALMFLFALSAH
ncbi:MAG: hypothetical protein M3R25_09605, partial [Bacteroidota bacterium]|nr:hypothetical protein [Bacteroidota bacterium]